MAKNPKDPKTKKPVPILVPAAIGAAVGAFLGGMKGAVLGGIGTGAVAYATMQPERRQDVRTRTGSQIRNASGKLADAIEPNSDSDEILTAAAGQQAG